MKLCRFSGNVGKFTNITNIECGSEGTKKYVITHNDF